MSGTFEQFTEKQSKILQKFVTNTESNIFCLRNLPEVIKGAVFSRYSRSTLGLRTLLLKEFIGNEDEAGFNSIVRFSAEGEEDSGSQIEAIKKAQNFYDRILDGYGDDSIGELGGAHLAIENVSMLTAKIIEDARIGGSPLEKSTRYIYFDQKFNDEYLFYREPILMTSAYRDLYIDTCNMLFDTYSKLIPPLTDQIAQSFPQDPETSSAAYKAALRAKVLDCLRGLLPAGTLTNMGVYGNGRFFESLLHKLQSQDLAEPGQVGREAFEELAKIMPSFVRRAEPTHKHHQSYLKHFETLDAELKLITEQNTRFDSRSMKHGVSLVGYDEDAVQKVVTALLFEHSNKGLKELKEHVAGLPEEEIARVLDAACGSRENRRHKSPRGLENTFFTFEFVSDFGIYRDLQRHRMLTQERQLLTCDYGYDLPQEIQGTDMESIYCEALDQAKRAFDQIAEELPKEAQYIVPMAFNIRWYFHINLRALQWLCELRSAPAGHPNYRFVAQSMAKEVCQTFPLFEKFFKFVDFDGYEFGRLGQEQRKVEKMQQT